MASWLHPSISPHYRMFSITLKKKVSTQLNCWLWASASAFVRLLQSLSGESYIRLLSTSNSNNIQVWQLYMGWIHRWGSLWMAFPSVSTPHFVSIFPPVSILFSLLRSTEASTLWSFFFLGFIWSVNWILNIPKFWAYIHLSVSAYHVCFFVTELPLSLL